MAYLHTRPDFVLRAHEAGQGLDDRQRIALGMALIGTVLNPRYFGEVAFAGSRISEHANALFETHLEQSEDNGAPEPGKAITHEQPGRSVLPEGSPHSLPLGTPKPRAPHPLGWRAVWGRIPGALRRLEDSVAGDAIALVSLIVFLGGLIVGLPLVFG